jgi:predicted ester cyclase
VAGVDIAQFRDGKVVEAWASYDMFGMLQQLGVAPALAAGTKA